MAGKPRQRNAANAERSAVSAGERILRECHSLYGHPETGLVNIASKLELQLLPPRKKINVMLMGNHSAGKSSFINWYVEEHIQRTGVAIETQGFTFVTSGRKRESLTGNATLHLYPHFKALQQIEGVSEYLNTEISTSKQKKFSLVTFIDTPGLVDGDMKYPFDVDQAILWLGELSELVFVFFDPMGQALCKRTLNIVERLNETQGDRIRFYLSKADEAGSESDRQRVMMQIVQELCKRPGLNKCGFDMPTIYIPLPNKPSRCVNQIEEVCRTIEKTISQTVQNTLNQLERDCELIAISVDNRLEQDNMAAVHNRKAQSKGCLFGLLGLLVPTFLLVSLVLGNLSGDMIRAVLGDNGTETLQVYMGPVSTFWALIPSELVVYVFFALAILSLVLILIARLSFRTTSTLTKKQKRKLLEQREFVQEVVKLKKRQLYEEYLRQSVGEHDLA
uniref:EH domain-containing protein 4 n=1 Tax=Pristiophorus japonicus TaxID=55135 RepID=UPI00398EEEF6